ncbi:MAG: hypothetical protein DSZ23_02040 [Thermodesulfatator sp.]|nr:MAG: hypothetical protein DSZ23_02040 [Thermodesulfatator sp.]
MNGLKTWKTQILAISVVAIFFFATPGMIDLSNADMMIYPAKGQSPEQQQKDEFECHQWAVQQTGFDPTTAQQAPIQETTKRGRGLRGAAGGALVGAGIGAIAGDAGKGAAIGAATGGVGGGIRQRRSNKQAEQTNQQAQANQQALMDQYNKARAVCLEGRGYTVK